MSVEIHEYNEVHELNEKSQLTLLNFMSLYLFNYRKLTGRTYLKEWTFYFFFACCMLHVAFLLNGEGNTNILY